MKYKGELDGIVLGVLQAGPAHGYEIVKRVRAMSEGALAVGEAKLYPCLHKLEQEGFVSAEWIPQRGKPARKVYSLTAEGTGALAEKRKAWEQFSKAIATMLGVKEANRG
ncbi:MAG TPA: helix-turn-helix transcriptional regulator [Fimbriimonadaceae bacterium]|nr:helix-turn-helix transcriptional regulator [Fimbriimonadaceae bacterium]